MSGLTDDTIRRMMDEATAPGLFVGASHTEIAAHQRIYVLCDALLAANERNRRLEEAARDYFTERDADYAGSYQWCLAMDEKRERLRAVLAEADQ